jgi:hypothetical protein
VPRRPRRCQLSRGYPNRYIVWAVRRHADSLTYILIHTSLRSPSSSHNTNNITWNFESEIFCSPFSLEFKWVESRLPNSHLLIRTVAVVNEAELRGPCRSAPGETCHIPSFPVWQFLPIIFLSQDSGAPHLMSGSIGSLELRSLTRNLLHSDWPRQRHETDRAQKRGV